MYLCIKEAEDVVDDMWLLKWVRKNYYVKIYLLKLNLFWTELESIIIYMLNKYFG